VCKALQTKTYNNHAVEVPILPLDRIETYNNQVVEVPILPAGRIETFKYEFVLPQLR